MITDTEKQELIKKVTMSLDTMRSYLQEDGGDIEIVDIYADYHLELKFTGNCTTCAQSKMTSAGIKQAVKEFVPQIKKITYQS